MYHTYVTPMNTVDLKGFIGTVNSANIISLSLDRQGTRKNKNHLILLIFANFNILHKKKFCEAESNIFQFTYLYT